MKESAQNVIAELRQKAETGTPATPIAEGGSTPDPLEPPWIKPDQTTGETVFDDRPLRFRSLTVSEPDLSVLEAPAGFHGGFKIRVAKLGGRRREAAENSIPPANGFGAPPK